MKMTTRPFDFPATGGDLLSGRLELPDGPVRGYALFAQCFTCTKNSLAAVRIARALAARGIGVLRFDFAGLGESGGDFADTSFTSNIADLVGAAAAMDAAGMAPSLLIGHSLGGTAALTAAGELASIKAVATIAAPFEPGHVRRLFADRLDDIAREGKVELSVGGRPLGLGRTFVDDLATHDMETRIRNLERPLLILHAPGDEQVAVDNAASIFQAARHPKSFVSLDGADHLLTRREDAEYAAELIAAWASRHLGEIASPPASLRTAEGAVVEETGEGLLQLDVEAGGARFLADEPVAAGGLGSGPSPFDLLSAALGACTAMTLRLYARAKDLPLGRIRVRVTHARTDGTPRDLFARSISLTGDLSEAQRSRLLEIAERCPVHRVLAPGARIETGLSEA